jgi:hypothetical protein
MLNNVYPLNTQAIVMFNIRWVVSDSIQARLYLSLVEGQYILVQQPYSLWYSASLQVL